MTEDQNLKEAAQALGRLPSGLAVVCVGSESEPQGFVGSWIQQASFSPLRITVAVGKDRGVHGLMSAKDCAFTVHVLDKESSSLMNAFFGKEPPFEKVEWKWSEPYIELPQALAVLRCKTVETFAAGDHDLILADVISGTQTREENPLTHTRNNALNY